MLMARAWRASSGRDPPIAEVQNVRSSASLATSVQRCIGSRRRVSRVFKLFGLVIVTKPFMIGRDATNGTSVLAQTNYQPPEYRKTLPNDGSSVWAGMSNYVLEDVSGRHRIDLPYVGELPHGDSIHDLRVDGRKLPGFAWGRNFAVDPSARYLAASWMAQRFESRTIVIDMDKRKFTTLPNYIDDFVFKWPRLEGVGDPAAPSYEFTGQEGWTEF